MAETLERADLALTNTSPTTLYAVPNVTGSERALVVGLNICNVSTSTADLIVAIVNGAGAVLARYAFKESLDGQKRRELIDGNGKLVLKAGEALRATASAGNAFELSASIVLVS